MTIKQQAFAERDKALVRVLDETKQYLNLTASIRQSMHNGDDVNDQLVEREKLKTKFDSELEKLVEIHNILLRDADLSDEEATLYTDLFLQSNGLPSYFKIFTAEDNLKIREIFIKKYGEKK